jgi:hypothetical protein
MKDQMGAEGITCATDAGFLFVFEASLPLT